MENNLLFKHPYFYYKKKFLSYTYRHFNTPMISKVGNINGIKFLYDFTIPSSNIKKMWFGSYQMEVKETFKRFLKKGDVFFDIGANIGYLSAFGAGIVGKTGQVHCFEPLKKYYDYIVELVKLNPDYNIIANNYALGEKETTSDIYVAKESKMGAHSLVKGFLNENFVKEVQHIQVKKLDDYIEEKKVSPSFIKIDVEGYEFFVLKGMTSYFNSNKKKLPAILVEITPEIYRKNNQDLSELEDFMFSLGYRSYCFLGKHIIRIGDIKKQQDILFKQ